MASKRKPQASRQTPQRQWPAAKVQQWPLTRLVPYTRNARTHTAAQVAQIAASIKEWGWTNPVLVDEKGAIIAGHGRVLAAKQLALKAIPVMIARGWSEAQKRAYLVADNKLALNAGWDETALGMELVELKELGSDLALLGFSEKELAKHLPELRLEDDTSQQLIGMSYAVVVRCKDEAQQSALLEKFEREGLTCEALIS